MKIIPWFIYKWCFIFWCMFWYHDDSADAKLKWYVKMLDLITLKNYPETPKHKLPSAAMKVTRGKL